MSKKTGIGNWIIFTDRFWTKPKVHRIASILGQKVDLLPGFLGNVSVQDLMRHVTCSALSRVFAIVNEHAEEVGEVCLDAILHGIATDNYLDAVADMPGIQAAMEAVGWVVRDPETETLLFPNYLKFNRLSKGSKRKGRPGNPRSAQAQRTRESRARKQSPPPLQTPPIKPSEPPSSPYATQVPAISEPPNTEVVPDRAQALEALMKRIDGLRPKTWGAIKHWNHSDREALLNARAALEAVDDLQWQKWGHFFAWCAKNAARFPDETRVTANRASFLDGLSAYAERAEQVWKQDPPPKRRPSAPLTPTTEVDSADTRTAEERLRDWNDLKRGAA